MTHPPLGYISVSMGPVATYLRAMRPQFFPAVVVPIVFGTSYGWYREGVFHLELFVLSLVAGILYHGGLNLLNDYFDHLGGTDDMNPNPLTPYAGGSRVIQDGLIPPRRLLIFSITLLVAGSTVGLYLTSMRGAGLFLIGVVGLFLGIFYSAPPLKLASRGLGEVVVALNFGVLTVGGSYLVQTGRLTAEAIVVSLPIAFLVVAILYINEFPDYAADSRCGKRNLVVRIGPSRGRWGLLIITALSHASLVFSVAMGYMPALSLLALLTLPVSIRASLGLIENYDKPYGLLPSIKSTISAHFLTGMLLIIAQLFSTPA